MGKKEKFIDKANSQKFHLLHRSLRDEAHASIEVPSTFVLVPAVDNGNNNSNNNGGGGRRDVPKRSAAEKLAASKDHINELGFANDGYDYSQHLREIGNGGTFISKTGQTGTPLDLSLLARREPVELPEDCMPSEKNLDKHYEAITINHKLMDQDIRAALFDGFDNEGDFEELDDDFVSQVINGPENDDFDFDAHIAKLIARSEQTLHIPNANREKGKVCFADYPEDEDDEEEFPDYLVDEADFHQYAVDREGLSAGGGGGAVNPLSAEARAALEAQFDRTLEEYEDEEIGYLEELDEEDFGGTIDFNEDGNMLDGVLDEFLQDKKDNIFSEGTKLRKGERSSIIDPKLQSAAPADIIDENATPAEVDVQKELSEQIALQEETEEVLRKMRQDALNKDTSIETCQEYLQEVRIDDQWDCETILSTYSTLDNHPTLIKDKNTKFRKYKSPHERALEAEAAASCARSSAGSVASRSLASNSVRNKAGSVSGGSIYGTSSALTNKGPISAPGKIVLSGRLNLPTGFGPSGYEKRKDQTQSQRTLESPSASSVAAAAVRHNGRDERLGEIAEGEEEQEEEDGSDNENSRKSGDEDDDSFDERKQNRSIARKRRNETAEEKKARKEAVKEERRTKRSSKKELRSVFKAEGSKMIRSVGNEQSIDHVSVFKYT